MLVQVIATLALTYAISRILLRVRSFPRTVAGLRLVHAASVIALVALDFAIKFPAGGFESASVVPVGLAQLVWYAFDAWRKNLPLGRPI